MMDRGIQPKGFYNDDAARLQEEFNKEHAAERENRMYQKIQVRDTTVVEFSLIDVHYIGCCT
jgi:hypothetical protein